jgi:hypothetical protein
MIPHMLVIEGQEVHECFFLIEKPGLDVAIMAGTEEAMMGEEIRIDNIYSNVTTV